MIIHEFPFVYFDGATGRIRQLASKASSPAALGADVEVAEIVGDGPSAGADIGNWKVDLASVADGTCRMVELPVEERFVIPLDGVKAVLRAQVDTAAELERMVYITPGAGQSMVYEAKRTEVARWRAAGAPVDPDPLSYPWAADRAARLGVSVHDVLTEWGAQADAWSKIGMAIENTREGAKEAIANAADSAAAREAAAVTWPAVQKNKKS